MNSVTVLVPITNDRHYLPEFFKSLAHFPADLTIAFYVNSSQDDSITPVRDFAASRPNTDVHVTDVYTAASYNMAMRSYETPYFLLLQPYICPHAGMLDAMLQTLESDVLIAGVGPLVLKENGLCSGAGIVFSRANAREADHDKPRTEPRLQVSQDFKSMRDRALLIRRISTFADLYWNTHHDIDWGLTASADGYRFVFEPKAEATDISVPMYNQYRDANANMLMFRQGGLEGLNKHNDAGTYYGSGFSYPAIETWNRNEGPCLGRIVCFMADWEGCGNYRVLNPYRMLVVNGFEVMFTMYMVDEFIDWADIVVFQRQCGERTLEQAKRVRAMGKPIIYEIDDFFHGLHSRNPVVHNFIQNPEELRWMEEMIYLADALVVSTPELGRQYGRFNTNTNIVPNYIDLGRIPNPIKMGDGKTVRIGWGGSATHDADMTLVVRALHTIAKEFQNVQLVFLGVDYRPYFPEIDPARMEWFPSTFEHEDPIGDYYGVINEARLDIGLAPLENTLFNRCKSDIKLVEYGAFGIVGVASDVEPYTLYAKEAEGDHKAVFLCKSERDWEKYLRRLITEPGLLDSMGRQAQKYVWQKRGIANMADAIEQVIGGLLAGHGHTPRMVTQVNPDGSEIKVPQPPVHSLNVPYLNNQTSKQASEFMKKHRAQTKALAAAS